MKILNFIKKITVLVFFVIIYFSTLSAKALDKFNKADHVSDYFSGILLLNENRYAKSFDFLKKLNGLETIHTNYSIKYLYSLVNSGNLKKAFDYSKRLEKQKLEAPSLIITGIFYLKNSDINLAQKYFLKQKQKTLDFEQLSFKLSYNWSIINNYDLDQSTLALKKLDQRFENLKKSKEFF